MKLLSYMTKAIRVRMTPELYAKLEKAATSRRRATGQPTSVADIVREAILTYFEPITYLARREKR